MIEPACPRDRMPLSAQERTLVCAAGHVYRMAGGIPVLLNSTLEPTQWWAWTGASTAESEEADTGGIDPFVQRHLVGTCGNLYRGVAGRLETYPVPEFPFPPQGGTRLLDVGCNWGRWSLAAERAGYEVVGIDPYLAAVRAARRVAAELDASVTYLVGDARSLPFSDASFDVVFSYSVLQHFSKADARRAIAELGRVLVPGGRALVQLASATGVRNLLIQARRGFRDPGAFDVRYWTPRRLRAVFEEAVGPARLRADGYFSLNPRASDLALLPARSRAVVRASELLRRLAETFGPLVFLADSVFVEAVRR